MLYKIRIDHPNDPFNYGYALVEADNIRTARNLAIDAIISVDKATELELVQAGREDWPIIRAESETATDDGQQESLTNVHDAVHGVIAVSKVFPGDTLPDPHAQTADTGTQNQTFTPSTGSAPHWLPQNPVAQDTGD